MEALKAAGLVKEFEDKVLASVLAEVEKLARLGVSEMTITDKIFTPVLDKLVDMGYGVEFKVKDMVYRIFW